MGKAIACDVCGAFDTWTGHMEIDVRNPLISITGGSKQTVMFVDISAKEIYAKRDSGRISSNIDICKECFSKAMMEHLMCQEK